MRWLSINSTLLGIHSEFQTSQGNIVRFCEQQRKQVYSFSNCVRILKRNRTNTMDLYVYYNGIYYSDLQGVVWLVQQCLYPSRKALSLRVVQPTRLDVCQSVFSTCWKSEEVGHNISEGIPQQQIDELAKQGEH